MARRPTSVSVCRSRRRRLMLPPWWRSSQRQRVLHWQDRQLDRQGKQQALLQRDRQLVSRQATGPRQQAAVCTTLRLVRTAQLGMPCSTSPWSRLALASWAACRWDTEPGKLQEQAQVLGFQGFAASAAARPCIYNCISLGNAYPKCARQISIVLCAIIEHWHTVC